MLSADLSEEKQVSYLQAVKKCTLRPSLFTLMKRISVTLRDFLQISTSVIRSMLQCACAEWDIYPIKVCLSVHKRALKTLYPDMSNDNVLATLAMHSITISQRQDEIFEKISDDMQQSGHKQNCLLPLAGEVPYALKSVSRYLKVGRDI